MFANTFKQSGPRTWIIVQTANSSIVQILNFWLFVARISFVLSSLRRDYIARWEQQIMRNLVRRYVTVQQRKAESQGVTEDDVNEIKQDISAFRCEIIEILKGSGMNTSNVVGQGAGKKEKPM